MSSETPVPRPVAHARLKLTAMFLLPGLAVILATLVYYTGIGIPRATTNKGDLVVPPRQIDEIAMRDASGAPWRYAAGGAGWGILVATGHDCPAACRERVTLARQAHKALGKEQGRVRRYLLIADGAAEPGLVDWLATEHQGLQLLHGEAGPLRALLAREGEPDPLDSGATYLVDPRGFVMMRYLPSHPDRAIVDDLRFLLRNSPK